MRSATFPLFLFSLLVVWLVHDVEAHRTHLETLLRSTARSVASTVDVSIAYMGTRRRQNREVLAEYLRAALTSSSAAGLALFKGERIILQVGEGIYLQHVPGDLHEIWTDHHVLVGQRLGSPRTCEVITATLLRSGTRESDSTPAGHARPVPLLGSESLDNPTGYLLVVAFDTEPIRTELALARRHALIVGAVGLLFCCVLLFWRVARSRAAQLDTRLLVAEGRLGLMRDRALAAAGLAHETKNPLGTIRGMAQICEEGSQKQEHMAGRIIEEVDRTVSRINEFLEYTRPREPRLRLLDLTKLLNEMRELVLAGGQSDIAIHVETPELTVKADPDLLRQVLLNLGINAVAAVAAFRHGDGNGRILFEARRQRENRCEIIVRDNGIGIKREDLPSLFNPYFSRRRGGTGSGCRRCDRW